MKTSFWLSAALLCSSIAFSQTAPPQKPPTAAKPAAPATSGTAAPAAVAPNAPVITITGLCTSAGPSVGAAQANCTTTVSKAEFEKIVDALKIPPAQRRSFAGLYAQLLAMANEGQKMGADKDPAFEQRLKLERLRLLAQLAEMKMQEATKPSQQDIQKFYEQNQEKFEQVALRRITVPKTIAGQSKPAETRALADKIQQRASAGEDPDKLQTEVWLTTKATGAPPSTSQGLKRRGMMDPRHEAQILQLKDGQVSPVIDDAQSFYIYKVDSKRTIPLSEVQHDISEYLQQQQFQEKVRQVIGSVKPELNDAYFGPPQTPPPGEEVPEPRHPASPPEGKEPPKPAPSTPK